MKKTITKIITIISMSCALNAAAQTTETFETFTLSSQGYYEDTLGTDWQDSQAVFRYGWDTTYSYWSDGSAYTNLNNDSVGNFSHLYNCKAGKGYNNSNVYVTAKPGAIIKLKSPYNAVNGFYVTNTTYAYVSMKNGDSFAKKFGGTSGNDPDFFKLLVYGYRGGALLTDSVEFYLADYRFTNNAQDYIVQNWQWVDCSSLGAVDSIMYDLKSSDVGSFGMNTPGYFSYDNFTTGTTVGINELAALTGFKLFPNPAGNTVHVQYSSKEESTASVKIYDVLGTEVLSQQQAVSVGMNTQSLNVEALNAGVYFLEISTGNAAQKIKFVKQ